MAMEFAGQIFALQQIIAELKKIEMYHCTSVGIKNLYDKLELWDVSLMYEQKLKADCLCIKSGRWKIKAYWQNVEYIMVQHWAGSKIMCDVMLV